MYRLIFTIYTKNSSWVGGFIWICLSLDSFAPAQLLLGQTLTYIPDIMTPPTPELFFYFSL